MSNDAVFSNDAMDVNARREAVTVQEFTSGRRADVLIIGGGIGGLAAATALTQKGLTVRLYERQQEFGEVGAGMQIASNCTRILDDLGLLDEAKRLGVLPDRMVMRDAVDSRPLLELDLHRVEERYGSPYMVIHRSDLHGIFLRAAQRQGVELHGGKKCVSYENVPGGARVTFADGSTDEADWGTPDELDAAFEGTCDEVQKGLPLMWRDRWWRMFDRDPIMNWLNGRVALLGDAAHPPLQYMAQGAIMAIEDGWVLAQHVGRLRSADGVVDWDAVLAAYNAVRPEHCRRILLTGRVWGELWHLRDTERLQRNAVFDRIDPHDWAFTDWVWGPTALFPGDEPPMFQAIPLASAGV